MRLAWAVVTPLRQGSLTRCSWAKPRTSATPRLTRKRLTAAACRSPTLPDFPIRGYEYYDLRHDVVNTTFRNYEDNATRKTGALSYLMFTSFAVTTNNTVERVKFVNAKPVYFPPMAGNAKWASDNGSSVAWKTAVIRDKDGSLGGGPNSYVLINDGVIDSIAVDAQACEIKPAWNAAMCKGDVGRLSVGGPGGGGRGGAPGGGAAGARPVADLARLVAPGAGGRSLADLAHQRAAAGPGCWLQVVAVLVHLVVGPAVAAVELLLSRQSSSAAMARTTT